MYNGQCKKYFLQFLRQLGANVMCCAVQCWIMSVTMVDT